MLKFSLISLVLLNLCLIAACERNLTTYMNPGCKKLVNTSVTCDDFIVVHIKSEGTSDTLHHIWDFTKQPSVMLALTNKSSQLIINWDEYNSNGGPHSISFTEEPIYVVSVVVAAILEFNDSDDTGVMDVKKDDNHNYLNVYSTDDFKWKTVQPMTNTTRTVLMAIKGGPDQQPDSNGTVVEAASIQISMGAFGGADRSSDLPHMLYSSNMTQMDVTFDHFPTTFDRSRLGVRLVVVTSDRTNATLKYDVKKNMDDEYAPGVFTMVELLSAGARGHHFEVLDDDNTTSSVSHGGYVQWRPIAYTSTARDDALATKCVHYGIDRIATDRLNHTLPYRLFSNDSGVLYQTTDVTFGQPQDGFYKKTKFASWTFVVGIGSPAQETLSNFMMMVLLFGIGLPLVLVVLGVLFIFIRRLIQNKDDFFLSQ